MDGVGRIIKNQVYKEVKSSRLVIDTPHEFSMAAQTLVPPITTIYVPKNETIQEPNEMENTPVIPKIFQIQKVVRKFNSQGVACIEFYNLPNESKPYYVDENTCAHCSGRYGDPDMSEWLKLPICSSWFHEKCFHL